VLAKPWRDLDKYRELRLREALAEAQLGLEFLEGTLSATPPARPSRPGRHISHTSPQGGA
jgi:hypothetical protein